MSDANEVKEDVINEQVAETQEERIADVEPSDAVETVRLAQAVLKFKDEFKTRSFSGRHSELGKMIKCVKCGRRHRDSEESCGTFNLVKEAVGQRAHGTSNPFWRAHPGAYMWIKELKKFATIHR
jgi:hypothetical protein